jgi:Tripartite tricarboxylate transporter TctB family
MKTSVRRLELAVSVAMFLLAAFVIWQAWQMPGGVRGMLGPGSVPLALAALLAPTAVITFARGYRAPEQPEDATRLGNRPIAVSILAVLGAGLLFERVGFIISTGAFLFVLLWMLSQLGWWRSALAALATVVVAKFVFDDLLGVVLPPLPFSF